MDVVGSAWQETDIDGLLMLPLKEIETAGGPVLHMLRKDTPLFQGFGEVYFSVVVPGAVKGWKRHTMQTQHFAVPSGLLRVVVHDAREGSATSMQTVEVTLGRPGFYSLLRIPPFLWYGFACHGAGEAILCNCVDIPHSPEESEKLPLDALSIPYNWGV